MNLTILNQQTLLTKTKKSNNSFKLTKFVRLFFLKLCVKHVQIIRIFFQYINSTNENKKSYVCFFLLGPIFVSCLKSTMFLCVCVDS